MFTRCPECLTVFHISAAELRAADGAVVCGQCDARFDALASLSETPPADVPKSPHTPAEGEPAAEPSPAGAEVDARDEEEFLEELESLIGSEEPEAEPGEPEEPEAEPGEPGEPAEESEAREAWEPEDELDEAVEEDWEDHVAGEPAPWGDDLEDETTEPRRNDAAGEDAGRDEPLPAPADDAAEPTLADAHEPEDGAEVQAEENLDPGPVDDGREPDEPYVGDEALEPSELRELVALQPRRRRWPAVLVGVLAVLVLAGAWAHGQRGTLLRHPMGAAVLGPVYSVLGLEATARWRPADFQALKWEAEADPAQPDRLIVAVEFVNSAGFAQPYPLLRVVLEDRFGRRVGSHDVDPAEYLEGYSRGRRLPAGSRVRAMVEVPDPGARAEGFRIDFCLESGAQGLVCSNDVTR